MWGSGGSSRPRRTTTPHAARGAARSRRAWARRGRPRRVVVLSSPLLGEMQARVAAVMDSPEAPPQRLTLTPRALLEARALLVLASGASKAETRARVLRSERRGRDDAGAGSVRDPRASGCSTARQRRCSRIEDLDPRIRQDTGRAGLRRPSVSASRRRLLLCASPSCVASRHRHRRRRRSRGCSTSRARCPAAVRAPSPDAGAPRAQVTAARDDASSGLRRSGLAAARSLMPFFLRH